MADMTAAPGWYYAQGDPPGTQRYWDGIAWTSGPIYPQPVAPGPQGGFNPNAAPGAHYHHAGPAEQWGAPSFERVVPVDRNPFQWWMHVLRNNYANFEGRARRKEYWWYTVINLTILVSAVAVGAGFIEIVGEESTAGETVIVLLGLGMLVLLFGTFIPTIAVSVRRLHDIDKSGWWILLGVIPIVNYIGGIVLLVFNLIDGTARANRYGPDPKGRA